MFFYSSKEFYNAEEYSTFNNNDIFVTAVVFFTCLAAVLTFKLELGSTVVLSIYETEEGKKRAAFSMVSPSELLINKLFFFLFFLTNTGIHVN